LKKLFFLALLLISINVFSQNKPKSKYYFAYNITINSDGSTIHYALLKQLPSKKIEVITLTKTDWILQAAGRQQSLANDTTNYFKKYLIRWQTVDQLWKLRYSEAPYRKKIDKIGWAQKKMAPSEAQMKILRKYGINFITDYFYGENAFKLLKDIQDGEWVTNYQNAE